MKQSLFKVIVKDDPAKRECMAVHFYGGQLEVLINGRWVAKPECELEFVDTITQKEGLDVRQ